MKYSSLLLILLTLCGNINLSAQEFEFVSYPLQKDLENIDDSLKNKGYNSHWGKGYDNASYEFEDNKGNERYVSVHYLPVSKRIYEYATSYTYKTDLVKIGYSYFKELIKKYGVPAEITYSSDKNTNKLQLPQNQTEFINCFLNNGILDNEIRINYINEKYRIESKIWISESWKKVQIYTDFTDSVLLGQYKDEEEKAEFLEKLPTYIGLGVFICILIIAYYGYIKLRKRLEAKRIESERQENIRRSQRDKQLAKAREAKLKEEKAKMDDAISKYGELTNSITIYKNLFNDKIHVFAQSKTIIIEGRVLKFKDILNCNVNDKESVTKGTITAKTSADTGSMIGRAAVGGALFGSTGAIIGGSTAKRKTTIEQSNDTIEHLYTINISVNDLSKPLIKIFTKDQGKVIEIVSLIQVVMANK